MHPSSTGGRVLQPDELYSLLRDQGAPDSPPYSPRPSGSISPPSPASRDEENIDTHEPEAGVSATSTDKDSPTRSPSDSQNDSNGTPEFRRYRTSFSREQITRLEKEFVRESYINKQRRQELARELHLSEATIKVWFQNRRMKDKRQKLSFGFPYADPAIASYLLHAASGYQPYLSPNALPPWLAPTMLSMGGPVAPIPYTPMDLMNTHNPYVTRYSPYLKPRVSYSPEGHQAPRPPVPPHAVPVPGISPPTSALRTHLSGCPTPHVPANLCSCVYLYSPYGAPAIPHPLPVSPYPVHAPPMAFQMNGSQTFVLPAGNTKLETNAQLSPSPPSQQRSPLSNLAASETKSTTTSPKLFKPYDEQPAGDTE